MKSDLDIVNLIKLSKFLVSYTYSKIEYEETDKLYNQSTIKLKEISDKINKLDNFEYPNEDTPSFKVLGFSLKPNRGIQLQILYDEKHKTNEEIKKYSNKLKDLRSRHLKFINEIFYLFYTIDYSELLKYYDIDKEISDKNTLILKYIITNTIEDLRKLYKFDIELSTPELYKGKSTIIELIINQKNICHKKIGEYYNSKEKTEFIQEKLNKVADELERVNARLARLQLTQVGKLLYKKEIEKSKSDFRILNTALNDLRADCCFKKEKEAELKKDKIDACYKYIKVCENLELLINELGEKTLKEFIKKLNIVVPITENNFFNEKEEMKSALKNWFINENIKIMEEIEHQTKVIEKSLESDKTLSKK